MNFLDIASLLIRESGSFAYHVILIITLGLSLALTRAAAPAVRGLRGGRWEPALTSTLILRLALLLLFGLESGGLIRAPLALPALDRLTNFSAIILLSWGLLAPQGARRADWLPSAALAAAALGAMVSSLLMRLAPAAFPFYNRSFADAAWTLSGLAWSAYAGITLRRQISPSTRPAVAAFLILIAGYLLHLALGPTNASLAPFVRWAELIAYPLLCIAGIRGLTTPAPKRAPAASAPAGNPHPAETYDLPRLFLEAAAISEAETLEALGKAAVRAVARCMRAEICLLLTPPDPSGYLSLAAAYDLITERHLDGRTLTTEELPVISAALLRRKLLTLPAGTSVPDARSLRSVLNMDTTGPIITLPLEEQGELLGGLVLLSPFARRRWSPSSQEALETLGGWIARRLTLLRERAIAPRAPAMSFPDDIETTRREVHRLLIENARLTEQLLQATDMAGEGLAAFLTNQRLADETIQLLESEIKRIQSTSQQPSQEDNSEQVAQLSYELQRTLEELAQVRTRLALVEGTYDERLRNHERPQSMQRLAALARELRQPMSTIMGYTELLLEALPEEGQERGHTYLATIRDATTRLSKMLGQLVNLAAIESGGLDLMLTTLDLRGWIREALEQVRAHIEGRRLKVLLHLPEHLPRILGDADALHQVLIHLLNNAIGGSPEGETIEIRAEITGLVTPGFLSLTVRDNGPGIPAEDLHRVFAPDYPPQGDPIPGLGAEPLELSIAKSLVEAMGGRLWVDSTPGQGTAFILLLPLSASETPGPTA